MLDIPIPELDSTEVDEEFRLPSQPTTTTSRSTVADTPNEILLDQMVDAPENLSDEEYDEVFEQYIDNSAFEDSLDSTLNAEHMEHTPMDAEMMEADSCEEANHGQQTKPVPMEIEEVPPVDDKRTDDVCEVSSPQQLDPFSLRMPDQNRVLRERIEMPPPDIRKHGFGITSTQRAEVEMASLLPSTFARPGTSTGFDTPHTHGPARLDKNRQPPIPTAISFFRASRAESSSAYTSPPRPRPTPEDRVWLQNASPPRRKAEESPSSSPPKFKPRTEAVRPTFQASRAFDVSDELSRFMSVRGRRGSTAAMDSQAETRRPSSPEEKPSQDDGLTSSNTISQIVLSSPPPLVSGSAQTLSFAPHLFRDHPLIRSIMRLKPRIEMQELEPTGSTWTASNAVKQSPSETGAYVDVQLSPRAGLILTTLQHLLQKALPGDKRGPQLHQRVRGLRESYEKLFILVKVRGSDAKVVIVGERERRAFESFKAFCRSLSSTCEVRPVCVAETNENVAKWIVGAASEG